MQKKKEIISKTRQVIKTSTMKEIFSQFSP